VVGGLGGLEYEIVGKIVYAGFDGEGNIHLIIRNSHRFWSRAAVSFLRTMEGSVVKMTVKPWAKSRCKNAFLCLVERR